MSKRVGVVLSGCGHLDGSEIRESVLTLLALERAGLEFVVAAPDVPLSDVKDHRTGETTDVGSPRSVLAESARIARGKVVDLAQLLVEDVDALVIPGGYGAGSVLSNFLTKGAACDVHPDVVRLLRGCYAAKKPMGFICLSPILAARVLGPLTGVRVTLGPKGTAAAKHAAVMGADVRHALVSELIIDEKAKVVSTPAYMYDDAPLPEVAKAIDALVRMLMTLATPVVTAPPPRAPIARTQSHQQTRPNEGGPIRRPGPGNKPNR